MTQKKPFKVAELYKASLLWVEKYIRTPIPKPKYVNHESGQIWIHDWMRNWEWELEKDSTKDFDDFFNDFLTIFLFQ